MCQLVAAGTQLMRQSQNALKEQLEIVLQTLKQQEAGATERDLQQQAKVAALANDLKEPSHHCSAHRFSDIA